MPILSDSCPLVVYRKQYLLACNVGEFVPFVVSQIVCGAPSASSF